MDALAALVHIFYWLSLAMWFGGSVFVAVAAPVIFRVVREGDPTLPTVLSVNLEGQHATLLAGSIVSDLLRALSRLALICAAVLAGTIILEWIIVILNRGDLILPLIRTGLFVAAVGLVVYDARSLRPRVEASRREYIDNADDPDIANPAKDKFDHLHRESVTVLQYLIFLLLGLVLFSAIGIARSGAQTFVF